MQLADIVNMEFIELLLNSIIVVENLSKYEISL